MNIIFFVHLIILLIGILIPFVGQARELRAYSILMVIIFFHWMMNDDTCALTQLEAKIFGKEPSQTFTSQIISPIYKIDDNKSKDLIKTIFFLLWLFTQWRLGRFSVKEFTEN
jgi:hypothetical protein